MIYMNLHILKLRVNEELSFMEENYFRKLDLILTQKDQDSGMYIEQLVEENFTIKFRSSYLYFDDFVRSKEALFDRLDKFKQEQHFLRVPPLHKAEEEYKKKMSSFYLKDRHKTLKLQA